MGEDENRLMEWRVVAPPTFPRWLPPRAVASAEHIATYDRRSNIFKCFPQYVVICSGFSATHVAVNRSKGLKFEKPVVEMIPSFTKRILDALIRPSDGAVECHRNVESQFAHRVFIAILDVNLFLRPKLSRSTRPAIRHYFVTGLHESDSSQCEPLPGGSHPFRHRRKMEAANLVASLRRRRAPIFGIAADDSRNHAQDADGTFARIGARWRRRS